jgi:hypothetical protein
MFLAHALGTKSSSGSRSGQVSTGTPCRTRCRHLGLGPAAALARLASDEVEGLLDLDARQVHDRDRVLEREDVEHRLVGQRAALEVGADAERVGQRELGLDAREGLHRARHQVAELRVAAGQVVARDLGVAGLG